MSAIWLYGLTDKGAISQYIHNIILVLILFDGILMVSWHGFAYSALCTIITMMASLSIATAGIPIAYEIIEYCYLIDGIDIFCVFAAICVGYQYIIGIKTNK